MRSAFYVGAKLLGVYLIYLGLFTLIGLAATLAAYAVQSGDTGILVGFGVATAFVQLGFGVTLFFNTSWFYRLARFQGDDLPVLEQVDALSLGLTLIGVAVLVEAAAPLVVDAFSLFFREALGSVTSLSSVWTNLLSAAFGLSLIVFAKRLAAAVTRAQRRQDDV